MFFPMKYLKVLIERKQTLVNKQSSGLRCSRWNVFRWGCLLIYKGIIHSHGEEGILLRRLLLHLEDTYLKQCSRAATSLTQKQRTLITGICVHTISVWLPSLCIERRGRKEKRDRMKVWIHYQYHYYFVAACRKQENQPRYAVDCIKVAFEQI